jgi:hypothetical protein
MDVGLLDGILHIAATVAVDLGPLFDLVDLLELPKELWSFFFEFAFDLVQEGKQVLVGIFLVSTLGKEIRTIHFELDYCHDIQFVSLWFS